MEVAIYSRVSTDEQNISQQEKEIEDFCKRRNFKVVASYRDFAVSGTKNRDSREFNKMLQDSGNFGAIVVYELSRLGRSLLSVFETILILEKVGCKIVVVTQPEIDTTSPSGKLITQIMLALAEFERKLLLQRQEIGIKRAKKEGKYTGRLPGCGNKKNFGVLKNCYVCNKQIMRGYIEDTLGGALYVCSGDCKRMAKKVYMTRSKNNMQ